MSEHACPEGHGEDSCSAFMLLIPHTLPGGHGSQSEGSSRPSNGDHVPSLHILHVTVLLTDRYVALPHISGMYVPYPVHEYPAGHARHSAVAFSGAYVPGKHSVGEMLPSIPVKLPSGTSSG